ncbi:Methionine--tRNA ligase, mitochondrial [Geodia barretti]|nr:Methionine--tRNA ligase, mitochondrial [Geodia barretti]
MGFARFSRRFFSSQANRAAYSFITTPIFYVNAAPHIGHLYTAVLGDAAHRWSQLAGATPTIFTTGTDEHGLKIQKRLFDTAEISSTDYVRTTENRHVDTVHKFWNVLREGDHIYKGQYEGWYSVPDETFLSPSQATDGTEPGTKVSVETGHAVEWSSEENYMFRLSSFRDRLLEWIDSRPYPVIPESSRQRVRHWLLHETNSDLSVSRPRSRLHWGVPVPNDSSQTIYVWLDALVNYLTVSITPSQISHNSQTHRHDNGTEICGSVWPATNQIVGKDILKFHAVYWPAFLMAAGLPLPRRIVSHAHWTIGKSKITQKSVWLPRQMQTSPTPWVTYSRGSVPRDSTPGDPDSNFTPSCSPRSRGRIFTVPPSVERVKKTSH